MFVIFIKCNIPSFTNFEIPKIEIPFFESGEALHYPNKS